jgi:prepilin-type N-terminal cleavage/methylation domain-containing protein
MIAFKKIFGFTLLELITVIMIIAIILLMNSPRHSKKKTTAAKNPTTSSHCNKDENPEMPTADCQPSAELSSKP